jgi:hypothetical protein
MRMGTIILLCVLKIVGVLVLPLIWGSNILKEHHDTVIWMLGRMQRDGGDSLVGGIRWSTTPILHGQKRKDLVFYWNHFNVSEFQIV